MIELGASWTASAMRRHLRSVRTAVWAALLAGLALACAFVPLFDVLGYEFAFAMALAVSLASADLGAAFVRRVRSTGAAPLERAADPSRMVAALAGRAALVNLALLVAPLVILAANGLRVRNCDWLFGLKAYALMPGLSCLAATATGVLCGVVAGDRRRLSSVLPYLALGAAVLYALWRFYTTPAVFSYSAFVGYFPGNLYDEQIILGAPFFWARLWHLCLFGGALALLAVLTDVPSLSVPARGRRRPERLRLGPAATAAVLLALAALLWSRSGALGFAVDLRDIQALLSGRHETDNFVIHYPPGGDIERDIELIGEDHEFRYRQVARILATGPRDRSGKITSLYFADAADKFRMMGARHVYMAKPWRDEIYLNHAPFPHPVLRHEIAHVVAGEFGDRLFRVSVSRRLGLPVAFNVGLIEGIAVAADWPDQFNKALTPHQSVKAMFELGLAPPLDAVLSTGFLTFSSARSYTLAGSFVRYLLDSYGAERLQVLYRTGGDFSAAYGRGQGELSAEWRRMIEETTLPPGAAEVVRERFRRPGIFHRPCPHAIANRRARAGALLARGQMDGALHLLRQVCDDAPEEPRYRLDLAAVLRRAGELEESAAILAAIAGDGEQVSSTLRAEAHEGLAALAAARGDWHEVDRLLSAALALPLDAGTLRNLGARRFAARHPGPAGPALRDYFWGSDPGRFADAVVLTGRAARAVAAEPALGLGHYLVGRNLVGRGAAPDAVEMLATALDLGLPDALLVRECAVQLATAAYAARDWAALERAAAILVADDQPEVIRLYGHDWLERMRWRRGLDRD